ncbi:DNA polymerase epsilon subunit b, putative [Plasmodium gallinaceum]|uniref:DNA polymerase epsilon subunit b, putative n=1 Tax=Plasmodium gallinaceum TaxID=5849 RepID=A0A1J1GSA2_PLAGA|nr:DNA polymerase epsilon subunit b, putative [Plasmodium gallinaceum]CRG95308.1 DNA polymerase epsilon subunit b, putative [Plasmodium gallinaceum]
MDAQITNKDVEDIINHINENELHLNKKIKRKHFNYENLSKEFLLIDPTYTQQYSEIYCLRIKIMKNLLMKTIEMLKDDKKKDNDEYNVLNYLKEIKANEKCYCIGTLFKKMQLRPSILKEYLSEINIVETLVNFSHEEDTLFLEDETARLRLEGNINSDHYVTGLTLIVKGQGMSNGSLYVEELIYSYLPKLEIPKCISNDDKYILFVSGLYINELNKNINNISLLRNFILGLHGDINISENLIRLIIVGNSLSNLDNDETNLNTIDVFISSICSAVYVDIMPGEKDPSDSNLPQQPFPNLFFRKSKNYNSFQCVTNPYIFSIDNINICCMSGESVNNISSYSKNSKIQSLKIIAQSRILSPTSPDTLGCYPFTKNDPFCIHDDNTYPHIFINGNCSKLEIEYMRNDNNEKQLPLLVCLPSFQITPKALLINTKNMDYKVLTFEVEKNI